MGIAREAALGRRARKWRFENIFEIISWLEETRRGGREGRMQAIFGRK